MTNQVQPKWVDVYAGCRTIRPHGAGKYLLWIDGYLTVQTRDRLQAWPGFNPGYQTESYAVCTFSEVPDTVALGHAIMPHAFVMQIDAKATMLRTNVNASPAQLEALRRLLDRVQSWVYPSISVQSKRLT